MRSARSLTAPIVLTRAVMQHIARGGPSIQLASIAGMVPVPGEPVDTGFLGDLTGVPDLVLSQPMISADDVADAVLECIDKRSDEIAVPSASGRLATVGYLFPRLASRIRPALEKRGAARRKDTSPGGRRPSAWPRLATVRALLLAAAPTWTTPAE